LDELVPVFLPAVPQDPFRTIPLTLERLPDGLTIYSSGGDEEDNEGRLDRDSPMLRGTDLGFRLWDVPQRRRPPLPDLKAPGP
jgi:hypothetical protein